MIIQYNQLCCFKQFQSLQKIHLKNICESFRREIWSELLAKINGLFDEASI